MHPFDEYLESNAFVDDDYLFVTAYKRRELTTGVIGREYLLTVGDWRLREPQPPPVPVPLRSAYDGLRVRKEPTTAAAIVEVLERNAIIEVTRDDTATANDHTWRKLFDGRGWAAEKNLKENRLLLDPT